MTTDLIKRLAEAGEGSRRLDAAIHEKIGAQNGHYQRWAGMQPRGTLNDNAEAWKAYCATQAPHYTTNLQDGVSAVPEGMACTVSTVGMAEPFRGWASISWPQADDDGYAAEAPTRPLALCIAILRALEAKDE